jgi:iron complex outermembrane recepter protein
MHACSFKLPFLVLACFSGIPVFAQQQTATEGGDDDIIVTGTTNRNSAIGDIKPEIQLDAATIRSYGVSSVADLIAELSPQLGSGQGRGGEAPLILLNGRRISSFAEIRDLPSEAIARVDILPEEVALKYGAAATRKVINLVLRPRFNARTAELAGKTATEGGQLQSDANLNYLRIRRGGRINLDGKYQSESILTESERDIISTSTADQRPFRSLSPKSEAASVNIVFDQALTPALSLTLNGRMQYNTSDSLNGFSSATLIVPAASPFFTGTNTIRRLVPEAGALSRDVQNITGHLGFNLNAERQNWDWSIIGNYDYGDRRTRTDIGVDLSLLQAAILRNDPSVNPAAPVPMALLGPQRARLAQAITNDISLDAKTTGRIATVPAGNITTTVRASTNWQKIASDSVNLGVFSNTSLSRRIVSASANVDIPVARRSEEVLTWIGDLTVNSNIAAKDLSDAGTLLTWGAGLNWTPVTPLRLIVSYTREEGAATQEQLGNPLLAVQNVPVFDFRRGVTTLVTQVSGGNPALAPDTRRIFKVEATLKPFEKKDLTFTANYLQSRTRNPIRNISAINDDFETAFPDRFIRAADGTLLQLDNRAVNFDSESRSQLRWGVNFSQRIRTPQPDPETIRRLRALFAGQNAGGPPAGTPPSPPENTAGGSAQPPQGQRGPGGFGGPGGGGSRLQLALYHNWQFKNEISLKPGVPPIDLLGGGTSGTLGGGEPRHTLELQSGITYRGLGARLTTKWQEGTTVVNGGAATALRFSDLTTLNLRLFVNLGNRPEWLVANPWFRGLRVSLSVDNLLNDRINVRDISGATPLAYQPAYIDPAGRTVRLSVRKLFF